MYVIDIQHYIHSALCNMLQCSCVIAIIEYLYPLNYRGHENKSLKTCN